MTGECLRRCKRHYDDVTVLAYSPDKMHFASASNDGTLRVWEGDQTPSHDVICQHAGPVSAFAWSPDSALLVSACAKEDQSLHFWDARSGVPGERIPLSIFSTRSLSILCMAWSPNGRSIAAGCDDGTIQILDVLLRRHVMTYRSEGKDEVRSVAWSPDGKNIAVGGSNLWGNGGKVRIWQVAMDQTVFSDGD